MSGQYQRRLTVSATGATTTDGAGTATATATSDETIHGVIAAIYLEYLDSPPAGTTDVVVVGATSPALPILTVANAATDGWFFPMWQADDAASGADITNQGTPIVIADRIKVTISQANAGDGVTATIVYEQEF